MADGNVPIGCVALFDEDAKKHPLPDAEIIEKVRAGETALFEVLMRRHNRRLYPAVRGVLRDESEVEEVMQQAYVAAYDHIDQFAGIAFFSTWLVRIGINEALACLRRRRPLLDGGSLSEHDELEMNSFSGGRGPEESASGRELGEYLRSAIDALPDAYRVVFMLREVEGLSTGETAECLGLPESVVKVHLHRSKAKLRDRLYDLVGSGVGELFHFNHARCDRVVAAVFETIGQLRVCS